MKNLFILTLAAALVACTADSIAPSGTPEAVNAKGGTPDDPPCDTYLSDLEPVKNCAHLKLIHPDSLECWNSNESYRAAVTAWEEQWATLECDIFP